VQFAFAHEFTKKLGKKALAGSVLGHRNNSGLEWPFWKQFIFNEELANCDVPVVGRKCTRFLARRSCANARKSRKSSIRRRIGNVKALVRWRLGSAPPGAPQRHPRRHPRPGPARASRGVAAPAGAGHAPQDGGMVGPSGATRGNIRAKAPGEI